MKRLKTCLLPLALFGIWILTSSDIAPDRYYGYVPYFMERSELERSVFYVEGKREMNSPGKIWVNGNTILVNERYKGVHIVDNSDPLNPVQTGFIVAPGCIDIALNGNIVYLDNAVDLVAFDMSARKVTERIRDYFPEPSISPNGERYYNNSGLILVGWKHADPKRN